jgi:PAS domain S-box-containing protein
MNHTDKTKEQLIAELEKAHARIAELEAAESKQRQVEEALRQSEERYRAVAESEVTGIGIVDPDETLSFVNPALARMLDYTQDELVGQSLAQLTAPEELAGYQEQARQRKNDLHGYYETVLRRKGGGLVNVLISASPLTASDGGFQGTLAVVINITEHKQAEEALWESEKRFRAITETASDAIIILDSNENIFYWNRAAQDIFGYMAGETRGTLLSSIMPEQFCNVFREEMERAIATGESDFIGQPVETVGVKKDGSEFPLELSLAIWSTKEQNFFTAIARDITARKQAEEALQRAYEDVERQVEERTAELEREMAERMRLEEEKERLKREIIEAQRRALL